MRFDLSDLRHRQLILKIVTEQHRYDTALLILALAFPPLKRRGRTQDDGECGAGEGDSSRGTRDEMPPPYPLRCVG